MDVPSRATQGPWTCSGPILGDRVSASEAARQAHGSSEAYHRPAPPDMVTFPESTAEVRAITDVARACGLPVVPFGAGTSLEGGTAAVRGGISIDFSRMNRVLSVDQADMSVTVQPGLTRKALNAHLRDTGLFFPIDPGADASIGGMTSTRASGTMAVRYGTMRDNVMALEAVLADGRIIRTGSAAKKSSSGYDLTRLLVGAEGTLGLITEIRLKLHQIPQAISAAVCAFDDLGEAVASAIETIQCGIPVARMELLDDRMIAAVNRHAGLDMTEAPTLFLEFHGSEAGVAEQAETVRDIATSHGGGDFDWATRPEDRSRLWTARDNTLYAALGLKPGARAVITDICVPVSRLVECLVATKADIDATGLPAPIVGHVGDGNFHTLILVDPEDPDELNRASALHGRMIERALDLGGTSTGEHGVGLGKMPYLAREHGEAAVETMRAIKHALDPGNMMNPGKIFPFELEGAA